MVFGSRGKNVELRDQDLCNSPIVVRTFMHVQKEEVSEISLTASHLAHTETNSGFTWPLQQNSVVFCRLDVLAFVFKHRMWLHRQHLLGQCATVKLCVVCQTVPCVAGETRLPSLALLCFFAHCTACVTGGLVRGPAGPGPARTNFSAVASSHCFHVFCSCCGCFL